MATLLFLGASASQLPAIRFARARGQRVVACDADPDAVAFPLCDVAAVVDFSDVDAVARVAAEERVDGVLAVCTDRAVVPAALVAERLGLPGLAPDVARAFTHKPTMRQRLALAGVPQPRSRTLTAESDRSAYDAIPLPAVLKPADSGGQRGLFRIERRAQLDELLPHTLAASRSGEAIYEEFVDGTEVNTLFVVRDGVPTLLTVSDRLRPDGVGFGVGWIHSYPSSLSPREHEEVEAVAAASIRALGLRDGIAFPQLIAGPRGVVLVEVAARIAAGQMADLVRHAVGVELYDVAITQALGEPVPDSALASRVRRPVAIRFFTASPGVLPVGTVQSVSGLDDVRASPGVLDAGLYFGPGTEIGPLRVDADRRGYVVATGASASQALALADAAARKLRVVVGPGAAAPARRRARAGILVAPMLAAAAIGAVVFSHGVRAQRPLIAGAEVTSVISPVCRCQDRVARIAFRLVHRADVGVRILSATGKTVTNVFGPSMVGAGVLRVAWNGRDRGRVVPPGRYYPDLSFPQLGRSLRLQSVLVTERHA